MADEKGDEETIDDLDVKLANAVIYVDELWNDLTYVQPNILLFSFIVMSDSLSMVFRN